MSAPTPLDTDFTVADINHPTVTTLLQETPDLFSSARWLRALMGHYRFPTVVAVDSTTGAALPVARLDDLAGRRLVAYPFSDYVSPPGSSRDWLRLAEATAAHYPDHSIMVSPATADIAPWLASGWRLIREAVYHQIPITTEAELWGGLDPAFRNKVRQAQRQGVETVVDRSLAAVDRFFSLHSALRNSKFSAIPQARRFFRDLHANFAPNDRLFVIEAHCAGRLAAACVIVVHGDRLYYKFSASEPTLLNTRANNLMLWTLLTIAVREGYRIVDLGRSGLGTAYDGLRSFKTGLGGRPFPISVLSRGPASPASESVGNTGPTAFRELINGVVEAVVHYESREDLNDRVAELLYRYFV